MCCELRISLKCYISLRDGFSSLAAVNFFLGCVGIIQVSRILMYQQSVKSGSTTEVVKEDAKDMEATATEAVKDVANKVKSSV